MSALKSEILKIFIKWPSPKDLPLRTSSSAKVFGRILGVAYFGFKKINGTIISSIEIPPC
jgi:hypothetical protein